MKCSYCGAEADHRKVYCLVCGTKLTSEKQSIQKTVGVKFKRTIPRETTDPITQKTEKEFPRTRAVLEEIFGPEEDWEAPHENTLTETEEDYGFPVTPCTDWPIQGKMDEKDSFPVYTTAPLRQDVVPVAMAVPEESEKTEPFSENALMLPVDRSMTKMVLLGLLTLGIYPTVIWSRIVTELNIAASRSDNKRTMPYLGMLILAPVTFAVFPFVWMHRFCNRVGKQLELRKCNYQFGAKDFWLWGVLGSLILVGPFVFTHKMMSSMNMINKHYNTFGG